MARKRSPNKGTGREHTRGQIVARRKVAFLKAYRIAGLVGTAAELVGIPRQRHYEWLKDDPAYKEEFKAAHADAMDSLEQEAIRRAKSGVHRLKFHEGQLIMIPDPSGRMVPNPHAQMVMNPETKKFELPMMPAMVPYVEHQYSDSLMALLLKAGRPKKFRENVKVEQSGSLNVTLKGANSPMPTQEEAIARFQALTAKLAAKGVRAPKK